jgi:hypothetical protein
MKISLVAHKSLFIMASTPLLINAPEKPSDIDFGYPDTGD